MAAQRSRGLRVLLGIISLSLIFGMGAYSEETQTSGKTADQDKAQVAESSSGKTDKSQAKARKAEEKRAKKEVAKAEKEAKKKAEEKAMARKATERKAEEKAAKAEKEAKLKAKEEAKAKKAEEKEAQEAAARAEEAAKDAQKSKPAAKTPEKVEAQKPAVATPKPAEKNEKVEGQKSATPTAKPVEKKEKVETGESEWALLWPAKGGEWTLDGFRDTFSIGGRIAEHEWVQGETRSGPTSLSQSEYFIGTVSDVRTDTSFGIVGRVRLMDLQWAKNGVDLFVGFQGSYDRWSYSWYEGGRGYLDPEGDAKVNDLGYGFYLGSEYQPFKTVPVELLATFYYVFNSIDTTTSMSSNFGIEGDERRKISIDSTSGQTLGYEFGLRFYRYVSLCFGQRFTDADTTTARFTNSSATTGDVAVYFDNENLEIDSDFTYVSLSLLFF